MLLKGAESDAVNVFFTSMTFWHLNSVSWVLKVSSLNGAPKPFTILELKSDHLENIAQVSHLATPLPWLKFNHQISFHHSSLHSVTLRPEIVSNWYSCFLSIFLSPQLFVIKYYVPKHSCVMKSRRNPIARTVLYLLPFHLFAGKTKHIQTQNVFKSSYYSGMHMFTIFYYTQISLPERHHSWKQ